MVITDQDRIGIELMCSVQGDEISIDDTTMDIVGTAYYTGVTGTGDTVPHLFKFKAVDSDKQGYDDEVRWDISDDDDHIEEAIVRGGGTLRYENIGSLDVINRVDHPMRTEEKRLIELYEEAKEEYEKREQPE